MNDLYPQLQFQAICTRSEIFLCVATGSYLYWDDMSYTAVFQDHATSGEWNISGVSHSENRFKLYILQFHWLTQAGSDPAQSGNQLQAFFTAENS